MKRYFPLFALVFSVMKRFFYTSLVMSAFLGAAVQDVPPHSLPFVSMESSAPTVLLLDMTTNTILLEKNAHERMVPSSMQKILTVYILLEKIRHKDVGLHDKVFVSLNAAKKEGSRLFLLPNEAVEYETLLKGAVVCSGNDACTALAEAMAGTEPLFAEMMNAKAKELGAINSHFTNASGLPDPQQYSTCWDLARIAQRTIEDFPEEYRLYYSIPEFSHNNVRQKTKNRLILKGFADGVKTGRTDAGKCGIVASAQRDGRRLLLVINGLETEEKRCAEAIRLLQWGFTYFQPVILFRAGQVVVNAPVWPSGSVALVTPRDIAFSFPAVERSALRIVVKHFSPFLTPIVAGQRLGKLLVSWEKGGKTFFLEYPLEAQHDVESPSLLYRLWVAFIDMFLSEKIEQKKPVARRG